MQLTLKQHRLVQEKSIAEMAAACDVHPNTYLRWEQKPDSLKVVDAVKIASALHVPIEDIIFAVDTTKCDISGG